MARPLPNPIVIVTGRHDRFDDFDPAVVQMVIRKPADHDMIAEMLVSLTVLFVVDDRRPVGILHVHDLLRAGVV